MYGACSLTRAVVAESAEGSAFGRAAAFYDTSVESWDCTSAPTWMSLSTSAERLEAWDAFLFKFKPLETAEAFRAFKAAAARFADIRSAICVV
jgi:hypothetical protein